MTEAKPVNPGALAGANIHQTWVSMYRTPEAQGFYEMAFDEIARRLNAPANSTILDAGCGSCAKSVLLAKRGFHVVGTDFSERALELAKDTVRANGVEGRITLRQGDLTKLPFKDGEFRYAVCWGVLMHVPEFERALQELSRVLAPGGILVLSEGNMHSLQSRTMRGLKKALGKGRGRVVKTAAGLETHEQTSQGALVTRQMDMAWFEHAGPKLGLHLKTRIPGQFTEWYVLMPWRWLRRAVHGFNYVWFKGVRLAGPAYGNILMLEKKA